MVRTRFQRCAVVSAVSLWAAAALADQPRIIRAGGYVDANGEIKARAFIVIDKGVFAAVNPTDEERKRLLDGEKGATGAVIDDFERAVLCPGLIDVQSALGAAGQLGENAVAMQPDVAARDAFDRFSVQLRAAMQAGVTAFALAPDDGNLIGGRIAVCKTAGAEAKPYVLTDAGPLKLSLSPGIYQANRAPTSRSGAMDMLRTALDAARASKTETALGLFARGKLAALVTAPEGGDVLSLIRLVGDSAPRLIVAHEKDVRLIAGDVAAAKCAVVVGPYDLSESPRTAAAGGIYEKAGAAVAIAGGLPGTPADSLRTGAAVAVRNGLSLSAARRAITRTPAEMLGVSGQIGAIENGKQADLAVFSGDPIDLRSRVLTIYIDGRRVFSAAVQEEK